MQATRQWFWTVAALLVVQVALGAVTAHYGGKGSGVYGIPLSGWLPYAVTRTWHLQLGMFWITTAWLATRLLIVPAVSGHLRWPIVTPQEVLRRPASSARRQAQPHSLSYQDSTLAIVPLRTIVAGGGSLRAAPHSSPAQRGGGAARSGSAGRASSALPVPLSP